MLASGKVPAMLQEQAAQTPKGSEFHSDELLDIMKDTLKKFKVNKNKLDSEESEKKHLHTMKQNARNNQLKGLKDNILLAEQESSTKEERKNMAEEDLTKTTELKDSDKQYMDDLTDECETKATAWDARSKSNAQELTAIAEALATLKGEVSGNYGANKKLVGLMTKKSKKGPMTIEEQEDADAAADDEDINAFLQDDADVSFLQKKQSRSQRRVVLRKMMTFLKNQQKSLKSDSISALMIRMKEDHFVKVRGMIKDMVAKLEADAAAEGDQKAWCDSEMEKATSSRDENIGATEGDLAAKTKAESNVAKLKEEIQQLLTEISELTTALNE